MMMLSPRSDDWQPPILATQALNDVGITELYEEVEKHEEFLKSSGELLHKREKQRKEEFVQAVEQRLRKRLSKLMKDDDKLMALWREVERGNIDPYSAVEVMEVEAVSKGWLGK